MATLRYRIDIALGNAPKTLNQVVSLQQKLKKLIGEVSELQEKAGNKIQNGVIAQRNGYKITEKDLESLILKQKELNKIFSQFSRSFTSSREVIAQLKSIASEVQRVNSQIANAGNTNSFQKLQQELKDLRAEYERLSSTVRQTGPIQPPQKATQTGSVRPNAPAEKDVLSIPDDQLLKQSLDTLKELRGELKLQRDTLSVTSKGFKEYSDRLKRVNAIIKQSEEQSKNFKNDLRGVGVGAAESDKDLNTLSKKIATITNQLRNTDVGSPKFDKLQNELGKTVGKYNALNEASQKVIKQRALEVQSSKAVKGSTEQLTLAIRQQEVALSQSRVGSRQYKQIAKDIGSLKGQLDTAKKSLEGFNQAGKLNARIATTQKGSIDNLKATVGLLEQELKGLDPNTTKFNKVAKQFATAKADLDTLRKSVNQSVEDFRLQARAAKLPENSIQSLELRLKSLKAELQKTDVKSASFNRIAKEASELETRIDTARRSIQSFGQAAIVTPQSLSQIDQYKKRVTDLRKSYQQLKEREQELGKTSFGKEARRELILVRNESKRVEKEINDVSDALKRAGASVPPLTKNLQKAGAASGSVRNQFKAMTASLLTVFGTTELVQTLVRGFRAVISVGAEFEAQMSSVAAISGATSEEYRKLTEESRRLGRTTSFTAQQAAESAETLAVAGFSVQEILSAQEGVLRLAESAGVSLEKAADVAAITLRGYGLAATEVGRVNDILTNSFTSANITLDSFNEANKLVAPIAKQVGLELEETAAIISSLGDAGFRGSIGGTALRAVLVQLLKPSDKAKKSLNDLGIELIDGSGNLRNLVELLNEFNEKQITNEQLSRIFGKQVSAVSILLERQRQASQGLNTSLETVAISLGRVGTAARAIQEPFKQAADANANLQNVLSSGVTGTDGSPDFFLQANEAFEAISKYNITADETSQIFLKLKSEGQSAEQAINTLGLAFEKITDPAVVSKLSDTGQALINEGRISDVNKYAFEIQRLGLTAQDLNLNVDEFERFQSVISSASSVSVFDIAQLSEELNTAALEASKYNISLEGTAAILQKVGESGLDSRESVAGLGNVLDRIFNDRGLIDNINEINEGLIIGEEGDFASLDTQKLIDSIATLGITAEDLGFEKGSNEAQTFNEIIKLTSDSVDASSVSFDELRSRIVEFTSTGDIANQKLDNLRGDFQILKSASQDLAIEIFDKLSPSFRVIVQDFTDFVNSSRSSIKGFRDFLTFIKDNQNIFNSLTGSIKGLVVAFGLYKTAIILARTATALSTGVLGAFNVATLATRVAMAKLTGSTVAAARAQVVLRGVLSTTPWGAAAAGIGLIIGGLVGLISNAKEASESLEEVARVQDEITSKVDTQIDQQRDNINNVFSEDSSKRADAVKELSIALAESVPNVRAYISALQSNEDIPQNEKRIQLLNILTESLKLEETARKRNIQLQSKEANIDLIKKKIDDQATLIDSLEVEKSLSQDRLDAINEERKANTLSLNSIRVNRKEKVAIRQRQKEINDELEKELAIRDSILSNIDQATDKQKEYIDSLEKSKSEAQNLSSALSAQERESRRNFELLTRDFNFQPNFTDAEFQSRRDEFFNAERKRLQAAVEKAVKDRRDLEEFREEELLNIAANISKNQQEVSGRLSTAQQGILEKEEKELKEFFKTLVKQTKEGLSAADAAQKAAQDKYRRDLEKLRKDADKLIRQRFTNTLQGIEVLREKLTQELVTDTKFTELTLEQQIALLDKIDKDLSKAREKLVERDIERVIDETDRKIDIINDSFRRESEAIRKVYQSRINLLQQQLEAEVISQEEYVERISEINQQLDKDLEEARGRDLIGNEFVSETTINNRRLQAEKELEIARDKANTQIDIILSQRDKELDILNQKLEAEEITSEEASQNAIEIRRKASSDIVNVQSELADSEIRIQTESINEVADLRAAQTEGFNASLTLELNERKRILQDQLEVLTLNRNKEVALAGENVELILEINRKFNQDRLNLENQYYDEVLELRRSLAETTESDLRIGITQANRIYQIGLLELRRLRSSEIIDSEQYNEKVLELQNELLDSLSKGTENQTSIIEQAINNQSSIREQQLSNDLSTLEYYQSEISKSSDEFAQSRAQSQRDLNSNLFRDLVSGDSAEVSALKSRLNDITNEYIDFSDKLEADVLAGVITRTEANDLILEKEQQTTTVLRSIQREGFEGINSEIKSQLEDRLEITINTFSTLQALSTEQIKDEERNSEKLSEIRDRIIKTVQLSGGILLASSNAGLRKAFKDQEEFLSEAVDELSKGLTGADKKFLELSEKALSTYRDQIQEIKRTQEEFGEDYVAFSIDFADAETQLQRSLFDSRVGGLDRFTEQEKRTFEERLLNAKSLAQQLEVLSIRASQGDAEAAQRTLKIRQDLGKALLDLRTIDFGIDNKEFASQLSDTLFVADDAFGEIEKITLNSVDSFERSAQSSALVLSQLNEVIVSDNLATQSSITEDTQKAIDDRLSRYNAYAQELAKQLEEGTLETNIFQLLRDEAVSTQQDLALLLSFDGFIDENNFNLPTEEIRSRFSELSGIFQVSISELNENSSNYDEEVSKLFNSFKEDVIALQDEFEIDIFTFDNSQFESILTAQVQTQLDILGVSLDTIDQASPEIQAKVLGIYADATEVLISSLNEEREVLNTQFDLQRKDILTASVREEDALRQRITDKEELNAEILKLEERTSEQLNQIEVNRADAQFDLSARVTEQIQNEGNLRLRQAEILRDKRISVAKQLGELESQQEIGDALSEFDSQSQQIIANTSNTLDEFTKVFSQAPEFKFADNFFEAEQAVNSYYDQLEARVKAAFDNELLQEQERIKLQEKLGDLEKRRKQTIESGRQEANEEALRQQNDEIKVLEQGLEDREAVRDVEARIIDATISDEEYKNARLNALNQERRLDELRHQRQLLEIKKKGLENEILLLPETEEANRERVKKREELNEIERKLASNTNDILQQQSEVQRSYFDVERERVGAQFRYLKKVLGTIESIYQVFSESFKTLLQDNIDSINTEAQSRIDSIRDSSQLQDQVFSREKARRQEEINFEVSSETLRQALLEQVDQEFNAKKEEADFKREERIRKIEEEKEKRVQAEQIRIKRLQAIEQAFDAFKQGIAAVELVRMATLSKLSVAATATEIAGMAAEAKASAKLTSIKSGEAVAKAAAKPFPANLPIIVSVIAALGAGFLAVRNLVKAFETPQQNPQSFAEGGSVIGGNEKTGGKLVGRRHSQGGIKIEAEGGEFIVNRQATSMFPELINFINEQGRRKMKGRSYLRYIPEEALRTMMSESRTPSPRVPKYLLRGIAQEGGQIIGTQDVNISTDRLEKRIDTLIGITEEQNQILDSLDLTISVTDLFRKKAKIDKVNTKSSL